MSDAGGHMSIRRILDANFNRAREAARVLEEYARFCLNDAGLTERAKTVRHQLTAAVSGLPPPGGVLHARDIRNDVGRDVTCESEFRRADAAHVARAAAKRLSEALRVIEEYGKTLDAEFAAAIENLRYEAYDLERRIELIAEARHRFGRVRLYVLVTESLCRTDWLATAEAALKGGAEAIQLREKGLSDRELLSRARRLAELCRQHDALFVVNDRADVAVAAGADGVHLGRDDLTVGAARAILPPRGLVGVSTHTIEQIEEAVEATPDYIAVGPMFRSATKPQEHVPGPSLLSEARQRSSLPLVAIGGIDATNAAAVSAASECCVCACRSVIGAADVEVAARELRRTIGQAERMDAR